MEIKTIEELACIPVENDDFAAASDQGEGDVILRPSLNYWQDAWRRLRKNPVAILAIVMLAALAVMCVVGPGMTGYDYDAVSLSEKMRVLRRSIGLGPIRWEGICLPGYGSADGSP